jgi:hypothetical protein
MTHIAFITLFLGLVTGQQPIQMKVTGPAAKIEFQVDGRVAGAITEPWSAVINFGSRLRPHRIVARALDDSGREVARAEQTINLPQSLSEVQLVLERNTTGRPIGVQMLWRSLEADEPRSASISLDGKPLVIDEHLHAAIPAVDLQKPHVLRGRAIAPSRTPSSTELAFGGGIEDQADAHLTPIAVRVLHTEASIEGALRMGGASPKVVAVEQLPGEVMIVRHPIPIETAVRLDPMGLRSKVVPPVAYARTADAPAAMFVWPVGTRSAASGHAILFDWSAPVLFNGADGLRMLLARTAGPPFSSLRFAYAVAVAGMRAIDSRRPRAVVLILGEAGRDDSEISPALVRDYLRSIGVPLYVWSLGGANTGEWGNTIDISSPSGYRKAFEELEADLQSQRIVWIDGDHLPADVTSVDADVQTLAQP